MVILIAGSNRFNKDAGKSFPLLYGQVQSTILVFSTSHRKTDEAQSGQQHGIRLRFRNGRSDVRYISSERESLDVNPGNERAGRISRKPRLGESRHIGEYKASVERLNLTRIAFGK